MILTVPASLATRFPCFTLDTRLTAVNRWWETGRSRFPQELAQLLNPTLLSLAET